MAAMMRGVQGNPEGVDLAASLDQVNEAGNLGDIPLTVITAGRSELPPFVDRDLIERLTGSWLESQRELTRLSSAGVHGSQRKADIASSAVNRRWWRMSSGEWWKPRVSSWAISVWAPPRSRSAGSGRRRARWAPG